MPKDFQLLSLALFSPSVRTFHLLFYLNTGVNTKPQRKYAIRQLGYIKSILTSFRKYFCSMHYQLLRFLLYPKNLSLDTVRFFSDFECILAHFNKRAIIWRVLIRILHFYYTSVTSAYFSFSDTITFYSFNSDLLPLFPPKAHWFFNLSLRTKPHRY